MRTRFVQDFVKTNRTVLHLNAGVDDSFIEMVYADALVLSPSAYSYTAALLSDGDIYYSKNYWHPPMPHWHIIDEAGH